MRFTENKIVENLDWRNKVEIYGAFLRRFGDLIFLDEASISLTDKIPFSTVSEKSLDDNSTKTR